MLHRGAALHSTRRGAAAVLAGHVEPTQIKAAAVQARKAAQFLSAEYGDGVNLVLGVKALLEEVVWGDEERADDAERAWERLGLHLGFVSTRPEKLYGTGPDNLWALSVARQAVIELKTGCDTDTIAKKDADQFGGSIRWLNKNNPEVKALPVMVHPSRVCDAKACPILVVNSNCRALAPSWRAS
ncbi:hypothetical protein [Streptomyces sp. NPDC002845]